MLLRRLVLRAAARTPLTPETKYVDRSGGAALVILAGSGQDGQGMILSLDEFESTKMADAAAIRASQHTDLA